MNSSNAIQYEHHITVLGRLDDSRATLCRHTAEQVMKANKDKIKLEFILAFETQFEFQKEELIKENIEFLELKQSPIIYLNKYAMKEIIGSVEEFLKWLITNYAYFEDKDIKMFEETTLLSLRTYMQNNGNKYCFIDISIDDQPSEKIVFELFHNLAPKTSENFLQLCKGTQNKSGEKLSYMHTIINRIVKGSYIQGGNIENISNFFN